MMQYLYHSNVQCTGDAGFMSIMAPFYLPFRPMHVVGLDPKLHITLIFGRFIYSSISRFRML